MTRQQYDDIWNDPTAVRTFVDGLCAEFPELFPAGFGSGYALHGHGRESRKLPGVLLRKVVRKDGSSYWLRPSFALGDMAGTVEDLAYQPVENLRGIGFQPVIPRRKRQAGSLSHGFSTGCYPLLLASHGVPAWLLTRGFGHNDLFWYRLVERLGRSSLVGTTVRDPARLPEHLTADEHHVDWCGAKGYAAVTAAEGCVLGLALTKAADDAHRQAADADFAAEARQLNPDYAPRTVNTDGWAATQNAFRSLFSTIAVVLCFLHGFLKIRDRCRKNHELHRHVWDVYRAATAEEFHRLMGEFQQWCQSQTWTACVREMVTKLWNKTGEYAVSYAHRGCRRTSNMVDRPMNRLHRLMYAGRGLHGNQSSSERRLRGWALLLNFRPFAPRSNHPREYHSPAHRLNGRRYHEHWLHNLTASTSLMGFRQLTPAIR